MRQIPQNHIHTRSTPFWNKETAPAGIFERHLDKGTRPGVYPRLSVMQGRSNISDTLMNIALSRKRSW